MECNACGKASSFRAREDGAPFDWWCHACYEHCFAGLEVGHDIEYPIICCACEVLPATYRVQSNKTSIVSYWCSVCYEREDHHDLPHSVYDLDSASDEDSDESASMGSSHGSLRSWQLEGDTCSMKSWHFQDDCSSNQSFSLAWQNVDDDVQSNVSSLDSFRMVGGTEYIPEYGSELWQNQQQQQQQQQQSGAAEPEQEGDADTLLDQEHAAAASEAAATEAASTEAAAHPVVDQEHATPTTHFGAWQESEDLHLAKVLSLQQSEDAIQKFSSSSSSSAAASSSNSSSSSSAAAPKRALQTKVPRGPLSDFQKPAASAAAMPAAMPAAPVLKSNASQKQRLAQATREEDEKNKSKGFKNKKLSDFQRQPLKPIQELATSYLTPSGCMEIMFNQDDDDDVANNLCPKHGRDTYPNCRDCANYEFMIAKRRHEIAEQSALELSLDNSKIVGPVGNRQCSKHGEDFKEDCQSCIKICDLMVWAMHQDL